MCGRTSGQTRKGRNIFVGNCSLSDCRKRLIQLISPVKHAQEYAKYESRSYAVRYCSTFQLAPSWKKNSFLFLNGSNGTVILINCCNMMYIILQYISQLCCYYHLTYYLRYLIWVFFWSGFSCRHFAESIDSVPRERLLLINHYEAFVTKKDYSWWICYYFSNQ